MALIVILAVMNGFQLGFMESILEISSFHIRSEIEAPAAETVAAQIRGVNGVASVLPFRELHGILRGRRNSQEGALIRGLPPDALEQDAGMAAKLEFEAGSFDIVDPQSILLGAELARRLSARIGDTVNLVSVSGLFSGDEGAESAFTVRGIFRSGFYEYDLGWGFVNLATAAELDDGRLILGVKLKNRWQDNHLLSLIQALPACEGTTFTSWRTYNRAFFGALRSEKLLMFLLVGLIFIVVGLNIFQAQRRSVLERREEIGLLRALGASEWQVRLVFVWDGFIIGLTGSGAGLLLGLLIAKHIATFFTILEFIANGFITLLNLIAGLFGGGGLDEFAIFSPAVFYIKGIPSRVIPREALLIFLFGFLSALLAAWFASRKAARTRPAEVLRYE
jgi:lipoprotein-releasing system permease protein